MHSALSIVSAIPLYFPNVEQKMKLKQMITDDTDELKTFRYKNVYKSNV